MFRSISKSFLSFSNNNKLNKNIQISQFFQLQQQQQLQQFQRRGIKVLKEEGQVEKLRLIKLTNNSGPIHDNPDFKFADGTFPETKTMKRWKNKRLREKARKETLVKEMIEDIDKGNVQQWF